MSYSNYSSPKRSVLKSSSRTNLTDGKTSLREDILKFSAQRQIEVNDGNMNCKNTRPMMKSSSSSSPIASPSTPVASTSRFKSKTPIANACYTPSSLFRSANASSTPVKKRPLRELKHCPSSSSGQSAKDAEDRLTVAVRVRPLNAKECLRPSVTNVIRVKDNELTVLVGASADASSGVSHSFVYDHVFYSCDPESYEYASQQDVFLKTAYPLIVRAFEGYNACLFAYGQTGSGKSYSMMGIDTMEDDFHSNSFSDKSLNMDAGIIPRFCHELFQYIENGKDKFQAEIEVSYFEIYNEKIHDLLCVGQDMETSSNSKQMLCTTPITTNRKALKVREHPIWGPYIVDLSVHPVDTFEAIRNWLIVGNSQRATAATGLNDKSSRSHSIFNIMLKITHMVESSPSASGLHQSRRSKISLVDLAGSERISGSNGERIREGVHINKSLLTLGKVISALSEDKANAFGGSTFVPYRESVLTWLLRENLGGNSKTVMLATISPASLHIDETLATLRYACQARRIVNRVKVNESEHDKVIRELRSEVERLKSLHHEYERQKRLSGNVNPTLRTIIIDTSNVNDAEVESLKEQLLEREKELLHAQKSWMERLKEAEDLRKSELRLLKRKGLAIELIKEQKQACLINLTDDPMLSGTLFYILPPGCVKIGRARSSFTGTRPDILLDGPLVAHNHCIIENNNAQLYVTPENKDFETYLNGELVNCKHKMFHGDRLVIGGSHFFRVSNPLCSNKENKKLVDFHQAYQEVLEKQEEKLRLELEEEKRTALTLIEAERIEHERCLIERMEQMELEHLMLRCNKEILESERKAIDENSKQLNLIESKNILTKSSQLNKSKLLDEINNIMQKPSQGSLHKVQLMVKEATQHCRNNGILYEFKQLQVIDEFGICHTKILIIDKESELKAEWPIARLEVWLDTVREQNTFNSSNIFNCFDIDWEQLDNCFNDSTHNSLNTSRITLNLSAFKDTILKQPRDSFTKDKTKASQTIQQKIECVQDVKSNISQNDNTECMDFESNVIIYVQEIQNSTLKIRNLCKLYEKKSKYAEPAQVINESIERLEYTLNTMQSYLDEKHFQNSKSVRFLID